MLDSTTIRFSAKGFSPFTTPHQRWLATPTGLEPVASTVTGWRDTRLHQGAKIERKLRFANHRFFFATDKQWWPGWDSNPQNSDFESDTYANSITRPYPEA